MNILKEVKQDNTSKVLELLQETIDINIKDPKTGNTLLHFAIQNQNMPILKALLSYQLQPNLDIKNDEGLPPTSYAITLNNFNALNELIKAGANVNSFSENENMSPLQYAAKYNAKDSVKLLLDHSADINYSNSSGNALHIAIREDAEDSAAILLNNENLDLLAKEPQFGNTFLHLAIQYKIYGIVQLIVEKQITHPNLENILKDLLNSQNLEGDTILIMAEKDGKESISNYLRTKATENGLDLNIKNFKGLTADMAKEERKMKIQQEENLKKEVKASINEHKQEKKKEKKNQEIENLIFEKKKLELLELRKKEAEAALKQQKKLPYIGLVIILGVFVVLYILFDYSIKRKEENYLDL